MTTTHAPYAAFSETDFRREVLESPQPVLVDFWAPWCGPCQAMGPVLDELATAFAGRAIVGKVNVDEEPALAVQYGIRSIPTLLVFKHGRVTDRTVGVTPKHVVASMLESQVSAA